MQAGQNAGDLFQLISFLNSCIFAILLKQELVRKSSVRIID
jgi:hypothetical protein